MRRRAVHRRRHGCACGRTEFAAGRRSRGDSRLGGGRRLFRPAPVAVHSGPPGSAQQRRRGSFLRQSNPDTAGRVRPRAPGHRS
ncbi:DUF6412 domain-containing protein [Nocardia cerradoensis]|uniref:DUF6412 domain-containing protein n=1 Tax=Nocardia cerradoensis TaxID=85688 RepID=UPI001FE133B2|nr:DUF6412 domain-containing protein [Nocardia cerradoensis]